MYYIYIYVIQGKHPISNVATTKTKNGRRLANPKEKRALQLAETYNTTTNTNNSIGNSIGNSNSIGIGIASQPPIPPTNIPTGPSGPSGSSGPASRKHMGEHINNVLNNYIAKHPVPVPVPPPE